MNLRLALLLGLLLAANLGQPGTLAAQDNGGDGDDGGDRDDMGEGGDYDDDDLDGWERPPDHSEPPPKKAEAPKEEPPPGDGKKLDAGLQVLWGWPAGKPQTFSHDAWNLGFGLRLGYTDDGQFVFPGVRAGLVYAYFLGEENTNGQLIAAEIAFDWWVAESFVVRPSIDLGAGLISGTDISAVRDTTTRGGFYFGPGLVMMHPMETMYIGGEVRGTIIGNNLQGAITLAGNVGARF